MAFTGVLQLVKPVQRRTKMPLSAAEIGRKVGRVINRFKVGKHFQTTIADGRFSYARRTEAIEQESELDGFYVIRTSEPAQNLSAEDTVRSFKNLAQVERAFRTLKGADLRIRPIHHRAEPRIRAHIFLCLLAYYLEWHLSLGTYPFVPSNGNLKSSICVFISVAYIISAWGTSA